MKVRTNMHSGLSMSDVWQALGTAAQSAGTLALGAAQTAGAWALGAAQQAGTLAASAGDATLKLAAKPSFWLWPFG